MQDVFIGRQPIFDRNIQVYGYELLYRHGYVGEAIMDDHDAASGHVMATSLLDIGLDPIVGSHIAFCNFPRGFLLQDNDFSFAADRLAIEILESVKAEPEVLVAIRSLAKRGHLIALDDFVYLPELKPLVDLADIIKIDVLGCELDTIAQQVRELRALKSQKLVAEKVETREMFEQCRELGFDYFQGFFFSKPKIVSGKKLPPARIAMMRLMAELQSPDVSMKRIEEIIEADVYLSVKLLRQVNSSYYNLINEVSSIRQAIVRVGLQHIRTWACILLMGGFTDKPDELMTMALVRAKMCELLSCCHQDECSTSYFTVGLFSLLDSILDAPMEHILKELPLSKEVNSAILRREGNMGQVLCCVQNHELANWDEIESCCVSPQATSDAYWQAVAWAEEMKATLD